MPRFFCAALICAAPMLAHAGTVVPDSYAYIVGPNSDRGFRYPDSTGNELTDGYASAIPWNIGTEYNNNVGWYRVNPTIAFQFDQVYDFTGITMNIQDTNGLAAVGIAQNFDVNGLTSATIIPAGSNSAAPQNVFLDLSSLAATDRLTVTVTRGSPWTFISEFTFEGVVAPVPLPASVLMLLAGLAGLFGLRRQARRGG